MKRGDLNTDTHTGRMPCEHEGKDRGDVSTSQGMPKIAGKQPELAERPGTGSSSQPPEGSNPDYAMILDFQPAEL